jgi:L-iditol 2-dehydrogenase
MTEEMLAAAVVAKNKAELLSLEKPTPMRNEVLIRVKACALCTWEQRVFVGEKKVPYPLVGGHEVSGEICSLGEGVDPNLYPIGKKAVIRVVKSCHSCYYCRRGMENLCVELNTFRMNGPDVFGMGGLAEYIAVDRSAVWQVETPLSYEALALTEPLACVMNSLDKGQIRMGDDVLVIGGGIMGQLHVIGARLSGARVILSEPDYERRKFAEKLGCQITIDPNSHNLLKTIRELTGDRGVDVIFNTTAIPEITQEAIGLLGYSGKFVMYSSQHPDKPIDLSPNWLHNSEAILTGAVSPSIASFDKAVNLINKGIIDPSPFVSAVYDYHDIQKAFESSLKKENFRVVVKF